ncbi:AraC family transcriptional regulator [Listeria monocytogenes WSLC1001]|nr:AraC family transcriptional regulator [Listeria monocytogenes WSLC1001]
MNSSAEMLTIISQYYLKSEMEKSREEQKQKIVFHHTKVAHHEENKEIRKALKYIEKNLNRPITLDEVASHVYLSSYYFSKLFKKEMNVNFINYVNQKKMSLAKEMLKNPRLSIDNIARNLGFTQTSYFCKVFRKEFDVTPKGYRETFK